LDPTWKICPFCEAEVGITASASLPRRRRGRTAEHTIVGSEHGFVDPSEHFGPPGV
jgi:hypothetical protein